MNCKLNVCLFFSRFLFQGIFALNLLCCLINCTSANMNLLIFGGNGFIGAETVKHLLSLGHSLTLVSRGNWPWDTTETVKPHVRHIKCNRYKPADCTEFWNMMQSAEKPRFDAVIDFSAYNIRAVQPFYETLLKDRIDLYIFISSDSVYEVSDVEKLHEPIKETDSVRPEDETERKNLNRRDSYGHRKLEVEEFLLSQRNLAPENSIPYVVLRLPDVLGSRDSTERFWKYHMWLNYGVNSLQEVIPADSIASDRKTSYVYVKDVAWVIGEVLKQKSKFRDTVYNVAFQCGKTLHELLLDIGTIGLGLDSRVVLNRIGLNDKLATAYFPSVSRGTVDVRKVQSELGFQETNWENAISEICDFYWMAYYEFPEERDEVAESLLEDLGVKRNDERRNKFLNAVLAGSVAKKRRLEL